MMVDREVTQTLRTCPNFVLYVEKTRFFDQSRLFTFGIALAIVKVKSRRVGGKDDFADQLINFGQVLRA